MGRFSHGGGGGGLRGGGSGHFIHLLPYLHYHMVLRPKGTSHNNVSAATHGASSTRQSRSFLQVRPSREPEVMIVAGRSLCRHLRAAGAQSSMKGLSRIARTRDKLLKSIWVVGVVGLFVVCITSVCVASSHREVPRPQSQSQSQF